MVTGTHPEDIELFDYVEGAVPQKRRGELEVHLASCAQCAEHVGRVRDGRDALRQAQFLELPSRRREALFLNLPAQRREPRHGGLSLKQLVAALTPVAVVAAVVVTLVNVSGNSNEEGAAGGTGGGLTAEASASAPTDTGATGGGGEAQADQASKSRLLSVAGPADAVAAELRSKGFDAEAVGNRVEVRNATRQDVRRALAGRRDGRVRIIIVH